MKITISIIILGVDLITAVLLVTLQSLSRTSANLIALISIALTVLILLFGKRKEIKENISVRCRSIFRIVSLSGCALILFYPFNNRFQLFMIFECIIQLIWHLIVQYQLFRQKNM